MLSLSKLIRGLDPRTAQSFHEAQLQAIRKHPRVHNCLSAGLLFRPTPDGLEAMVSGFGHGLKVGDFLIKKNDDHGPDGQTRYRLTEIRYCDDPRDQWFGKVVFDRRTAEQKDRDIAHTERGERSWDLD